VTTSLSIWVGATTIALASFRSSSSMAFFAAPCAGAETSGRRRSKSSLVSVQLVVAAW
jgi:hypothetical protein